MIKSLYSTYQANFNIKIRKKLYFCTQVSIFGRDVQIMSTLGIKKYRCGQFFSKNKKVNFPNIGPMGKN